MSKSDGESDWIRNSHAVAELSGARLTFVDFVLNYLILGFDDVGALTTLVWPVVHRGKGAFRFGMEGYRDELCSLITKVVKNATMDVNETISFDFGDETELRVPLATLQRGTDRVVLQLRQSTKVF